MQPIVFADSPRLLRRALLVKPSSHTSSSVRCRLGTADFTLNDCASKQRFSSFVIYCVVSFPPILAPRIGEKNSLLRRRSSLQSILRELSRCLARGRYWNVDSPRVPPREVRRSRTPRPAWPSERDCIATPPPPRPTRSKTSLCSHDDSRAPSEYIKIFRVLNHLRRGESLPSAWPSFSFLKLHSRPVRRTRRFDKFFLKICGELTARVVEHGQWRCKQFSSIKLELSIVVRYCLRVRPGPYCTAIEACS